MELHDTNAVNQYFGSLKIDYLRRKCVVPENIHSLPPATEGKGRGGPKGGTFRGGGGLLTEFFFSGDLDKIGEVLKN